MDVHGCLVFEEVLVALCAKVRINSSVDIRHWAVLDHILIIERSNEAHLSK
jgi:hypothetical protein